MAQWKIESLGISSDDFASAKDDSGRKGHYGHTWRYAQDQDYQRHMAGNVETKVDQQSANSEPVQIRQEEDHLVSEIAEVTSEMPSYSEQDLMIMSKEQLVEIASAVGVANLELKKPKLVEAILEKLA